MSQNFCHDLASAALRHRLRDRVARLVYRESIAPHHRDVRGLLHEVRLMWKDNGCQPIRFRERDQSALTRRISREIANEINECWVVKCSGEGNSLGFIDVIGEGSRIAET
jgi:hypothetical protein